jgi:hypothetical protein
MATEWFGQQLGQTTLERKLNSSNNLRRLKSGLAKLRG